MANDTITNSSTGVTPEQLGGSGPSTDLNAQNMPTGATRVENGIAYDASGKQLGSVSETPAPQAAAPTQPSLPPPPPGFGPVVPINRTVGSTQPAAPAASAAPSSALPPPPPGFGPVVLITHQPPAPQAAPQKQPDPNYVGHNFDPLSLEDWHKAYFGQGTAMGQGATPAMQQEGSGVSDILHSNVRQGLGKIFGSESMHIVQGSPVEKLIQQFNPDFKGGVDQAYADANTRHGNMVNSSQFIDKTKHPVIKALTEVADSFTSPSNIAIMAETGGLGMISRPQALAVSNRLLAAGFSANAIGTAYQNLKGFKEAYDKGDDIEAKYMLTHAVVNGTMGWIAANSASEGALNASVKNAVTNPIEAAKGVASAVSDIGNSIPGVERGRQYVAEKVVGPLVKKPAGATLEDEKFNREPVQAILDEGLVGTKKGLVEKADNRISELSEGVDHVLQNHENSNVIIDAEPVIDSAIDAAQKVAKKSGSKSTVTALEDLRTALKTEYGAVKGTPFEMNNFKKDIGDVGAELGAFRSTDPTEASKAAAMGDVYRGIKELVNEQVPEVAPLNDRISNLISAKTGLRRNIVLGTNKPVIDSHTTVLGLAGKALERTVTSAPVRTGLAKVIKPGETLEVTPRRIHGGVPERKYYAYARV